VDVDLLLYDRRTVTSQRLIIPHPEMRRRRFVLAPLVEVAPDAVLPDGTPVASYLQDVADQDVRRVGDP
jgi:2-amino-4-hydroxy-6-hydroxymethyldihydropteridine diphosphokinase